MWPNQSAPRGPSGLLRDARRHAGVCGSPSRAIDGNADRGRGGAPNGMTWELTGLKTVLEPPPLGGGSFVFQARAQRHRYRRGEAPVAGRSPTPSWAGFESLHPCWCDAPVFRYGLYPSRPNRSLKTEEIANKRIGDARMPRRKIPPIQPRDAVTGRHLAVTQAPSGSAGSTPAPRTTGPEHERQCNSLARSEVTVRARLGPQCRAPPASALRAGVAEQVDAPGSDPGGRCPLRVRLSPPARLRPCGNGKPGGLLPRGSEFESPGAHFLVSINSMRGEGANRAFGSGAMAAHLALNQEMGDRLLPPELDVLAGTNDRLWRSW